MEAQINELRARVAEYEVPELPPEPAGPPKGLVKLGKKTADGLVRLDAPTA